ncbi:MAG: hypothetical protein WD845_05920 [Pirellulales bacterium]
MYDVRPGKPELDETGGAGRSRGSLLPVIIILGFGLTLVLGLISVAGLAGLYIVAAFCAVLGFVAFHYILWGWWLTNRLRDDERRRDANGDQ